MPNNGISEINATNGHATAATAVGSGKPSLSTFQHKSESATTALANNNDLQQKTSAGPAQAVNTLTTANPSGLNQHRRDNSSLSGQSKRDSSKFQYAAAQTKLTAVSSSGKKPSITEAKANDLVYYDGELISGSLEALITHMVPTSDYYPDRNYIFAFLLSARLFVRPHELLAQISQTWERQQQHNEGHDAVDDAAASLAAHQQQHLSYSRGSNSASPLVQRKIVQSSSGSANASPSHAAGIYINSGEQQLPLPLQRSAIQKSAQNCVRLLAEWIETFPYDFRDERLMQQVRILARKCVYIDNALGKQVSRILQLLVQRLTTLEKYQEFLHSLLMADLSQYNAPQQAQHFNSTSAAASTAVTHNTLGKSLNLNEVAAASLASNSHHSADGISEIQGLMELCPSCAVLAHQLTAIELERLSHIGPEEFVQAFAKEYSANKLAKNSSKSAQAASGSSGADSSSADALNDMKKTRNLESYVEWFNRLSYLTASEIVKYPKKKQRVRIIEYWIETARECFNIGNFNSLMAIIAGLNLEPISRLKKTWSKVQCAKFSVLEHQMDPTSNFNSYRSTLKAAMWRSEGATDERERIIIPFFSLFVKDLYFVNEGCSNRLPNNHINFEKCSQLAKQIMEFNEWKKVSCPFEQQPAIMSYLQTAAVLNENTLSMASFECEPPDNHEEKGRYKTVKAESKQQLLQQLQQQQ